MTGAEQSTGDRRVSIGLPVYNGAEYLESAVDALLAQTFDDFELIISDNASSDDTEGVCRDLVRRDERIRYVRQPTNLGAANNFNVVVELAHAPFFKWASHDDLVDPTFLEVCMDAFADAPSDILLCYPRSYLIDEQGAVIQEFPDNLDLRDDAPHLRLRAFLDRYNMSNPIFGVFRSSMLRRTNLLQPFESSDLVLMAEMAMLGKFWELEPRLFRRRFHAEMSRRANTSPEDVAAWFDPNNPQPITMARTKVFMETARSIQTADLGLSASEKLRCHAQLVGAGGIHEFRVMGGEAKAAVIAKMRAGGVRRSRSASTS
jgi:glycosyltransferase involved in cell wall biosynthesis